MQKRRTVIFPSMTREMYHEPAGCQPGKTGNAPRQAGSGL